MLLFVVLIYSPDGSSDSDGVEVIVLLHSHCRPCVSEAHRQQCIGRDTVAVMFMT